MGFWARLCDGLGNEENAEEQQEELVICFTDKLGREAVEIIAQLLNKRCNGQLRIEVHSLGELNAIFVRAVVEEVGNEIRMRLESNGTTSCTNGSSCQILNSPVERLLWMKETLFNARTGPSEGILLPMVPHIGGLVGKRKSSLLEQFHFIDQEVEEEEEEEETACSVQVICIPANTQIVPYLQSSSPVAIQQIFPLHQPNRLRRLRRNWVFGSPVQLISVPLTTIRAYFGNEIALYFGWLSFYSVWLVAPALIGALVYLFLPSASKNAVPFVLFGLFNSLWALVFMKSWEYQQKQVIQKMMRCKNKDKKQNHQQKLLPGMDDSNPTKVSAEKEAHSLAGTVSAIPVNLSMFCCWHPLDLVCFSALLCVLCAMFWVQDYVQEHYGNWFLITAILILQGLICLGADALYRVFVVQNIKRQGLNEQQADDAFIIRITVFWSISSFSYFYYIAFWRNDWERLNQSLVTLFLTTQLVQNLAEVGVPLLLGWFWFTKSKVQMLVVETGGNDAASIANNSAIILEKSRAEMEAAKPDYDRPLDDYLEIILQLGYVLLFSPAFPLAAACAVLNNLIEIRVDAFKLCFSYRRPWPRRTANGIGAWKIAIKTMCIFGVVTNLALILRRCWPIEG